MGGFDVRRETIFLAGVLCVAVLAGCSGSSEGGLAVFFPGLGAPAQVLGGAVFGLDYRIGGSPAGSTVDFAADVDGDIATTGDQVPIAVGRVVTNGQNEQVQWDTAGVQPAVYRIVAIVRTPAGGTVTGLAPGRVTIATFAFAALQSARTALVGTQLPIDYSDHYPGADATTDLYADGDGDLATTGDQIALDLGRIDLDGAAQQFLWDTTGVATGSYFIVAVFSQGTFSETILSAAVTVNDIVEFLPADATTLRGTAFNVRVRFAEPLGSATIGSTTVPVIADGLSVPGSYFVDNTTDIVFTPTACTLPAPAACRVDVWTTLGLAAGAPAVFASAAFDTAASPVYVGPDLGGGSISVVDAIGQSEITSIPLQAPDGPWFSRGATDGTIYFSTRGEAAADGYLIVVDSDTNTIADRMSLTKADPMAALFAAGMDLSPDETELYVAVFEGTDPQDDTATKFLVVVDRTTGMEAARIPLVGNGRLRDVAVTPDGSLAFVPSYDESAIHVVDLVARTEIDTDGSSGNGVTPMPTTIGFPGGVALDATGTTLFVGHGRGGEMQVSRFDTSTYAELAPLMSTAIANSTGPDIAFNPCDGRVYAGRVQFDSDMDPAISIFDPSGPTEFFAFARDGFAGYRNVAFVWGTTIVATGNRVSNNRIFVFDSRNLANDAVPVTTTAVTGHTVATIPPVRH